MISIYHDHQSGKVTQRTGNRKQETYTVVPRLHFGHETWHEYNHFRAVEDKVRPFPNTCTSRSEPLSYYLFFQNRLDTTLQGVRPATVICNSNLKYTSHALCVRVQGVRLDYLDGSSRTSESIYEKNRISSRVGPTMYEANLRPAPGHEGCHGELLNISPPNEFVTVNART